MSDECLATWKLLSILVWGACIWADSDFIFCSRTHECHGLGPGPRPLGLAGSFKSWARSSTCRYSNAQCSILATLYKNRTRREVAIPRLTSPSPSYRNNGIAPLLFQGCLPLPPLPRLPEVITQRLSQHSGLPRACMVRMHVRTRKVSLPEPPIAAAAIKGIGSISRSAESTPAETT